MSTRSHEEQVFDSRPWPAAAIRLSGYIVFINATLAHGLHVEAGANWAQPYLPFRRPGVFSGIALENPWGFMEQDHVAYRIRLKPSADTSLALSAMALYAESAESQTQHFRAKPRAVIDHFSIRSPVRSSA